MLCLTLFMTSNSSTLDPGYNFVMIIKRFLKWFHGSRLNVFVAYFSETLDLVRPLNLCLLLLPNPFVIGNRMLKKLQDN